MNIQYLEVVTNKVDEVCQTYESVYGVKFCHGVPELGNARTAQLESGGMIGVRAPMHETEEPIIRPYMLVDDIEKAVEKISQSGGEILHPAMEIPGHGKFAIYSLGDNNLGLWQL